LAGAKEFAFCGKPLKEQFVGSEGGRKRCFCASVNGVLVRKNPSLSRDLVDSEILTVAFTVRDGSSLARFAKIFLPAAFWFSDR
jgi:hypothetical protein